MCDLFKVSEHKIETENLILRSLEESDLNDFYEYASVEGVGEMAGFLYHKNLDESKKTLKLLKSSDSNYAIYHKQSCKMIGTFGVMKSSKLTTSLKVLELGYVISKNFWGNGYALEALNAVIKVIKDNGYAEVVVASHFVENDQSRRVLEKCGFTYHSKIELKCNQLNCVKDSLLHIKYL